MGDHDDVGPELPHALDDFLIGQVKCGGVDEGDGTAGVEERTADHEQTKRHLMADAVVADGRLQRSVDQGNAKHGAFSEEMGASRQETGEGRRG